MSKKDVEKYYDTVNAQYHSFVEELSDFEDLCASNLVSPEVVTNAKKCFQVVKDNWERLNYVMYLLNKPVKKSKHEKYNRTSKKLLDNSISDKQVIKENQESNTNFKNIVKN